MKAETKDFGTETHPTEGVLKEKFPYSKKPSHRCVCGELWNPRGQHHQEQKKSSTEYKPNLNYSLRYGTDAHVQQHQVGAWQGGLGCTFGS